MEQIKITFAYVIGATTMLHHIHTQNLTVLFYTDYCIIFFMLSDEIFPSADIVLST